MIDLFDDEEEDYGHEADAQASADIEEEALPHTRWMDRARADARSKGVPLKQFLADHSHVKDSTRDSYLKAIRHFEDTVVAVAFPDCDMCACDNSAMNASARIAAV